jgi:hypothetical protein
MQIPRPPKPLMPAVYVYLFKTTDQPIFIFILKNFRWVFNNISRNFHFLLSSKYAEENTLHALLPYLEFCSTIAVEFLLIKMYSQSNT